MKVVWSRNQFDRDVVENNLSQAKIKRLSFTSQQITLLTELRREVL